MVMRKARSCHVIDGRAGARPSSWDELDWEAMGRYTCFVPKEGFLTMTLLYTYSIYIYIYTHTHFYMCIYIYAYVYVYVLNRGGRGGSRYVKMMGGSQWPPKG